MPEDGGPEDPRFLGAIEMLKRTGAASLQIRYSDDEEPVVWFVVAEYVTSRGSYYETAAAISPLSAVLRLCGLMMNGGECTHCHRPTKLADVGPVRDFDEGTCYYYWDADNATYARGCET